ncbi:PCYCGC domain-containing protein [Bacillus kexueae]|uniref:PCYCGC domain-containing protein n=1 Tax=Aeribacillus kexueae TaxID=2078952 RepID=UPI001FAEDA78|nr:PCYCGC domain-containing protein [Bacillus kexueae]
MKKIVISSLLLSVTLLTGCQQNHDDSSHITHLSNGDIREVTVSVDELPTFLDHQPEQVQTIYRLAAKHEELLRSIPCYCGCAESANHRDNFECFVHEINENGEIVWDDHGTKCNVCLEIAANSIVLYEEGKSVKEIRSEIDNRYENGYAKPTPTPEV